MDKVYVMDNRGREKEATKVRYFKYNDNCYFVYTLNELDNEGYVKLYIKKIVGDEDRSITDEEWPTVRGIVQEVFREIKAGTHYSYEDLDLRSINEIMNSGARIFRLKKVVVDDILSKRIDSDEALERDINTKLINDALNKSLMEEAKETPKRVDRLSKNDKAIEDENFNSDLLSLLKKVQEASKADELFNTPDSLSDKLLKDDHTSDLEDRYNKISSNESRKIKPVVIGSVPIVEYKEKIKNLENEIRMYQDSFFNLKKELEKFKNENIRLNEDIKNSKLIISKYIDKIENLKNIIKDI